MTAAPHSRSVTSACPCHACAMRARHDAVLATLDADVARLLQRFHASLARRDAALDAFERDYGYDPRIPR